MKNTVLDVIVVGAGHAGLSASYYLKKYELSHLVIERGKIGESWSTQRWDSFVLNTANSINVLPGNYRSGEDPQKFPTASGFVSFLKGYASKFQLPVVEETEVILIEKPLGQQYFTVTVSQNGVFKNYFSTQLIICSGSQNKKKIPVVTKNISEDILQLHVSEYKNIAQLPMGSVLVVGSAQSGCQVAEDISTGGRKVYLSTSMVARVPRRYRGKDIMDWLIAARFFDTPAKEIPDPKMLHMPAPQLTGTNSGNKTISLQAMAKKGISILGRMKYADDQNLFFQPDAAEHVKFADEFSSMVKGIVDEYILQNQLSAPAAENDWEDLPDINASCVSPITSINLKEHNINTVIWATGFGADFNYLNLPVLDNEGNPKHANGITAVDGLYFLGLPWLRTRKSSLIHGIKDDAAFIVEKLYQYAQHETAAAARQSI